MRQQFKRLGRRCAVAIVAQAVAGGMGSHSGVEEE